MSWVKIVAITLFVLGLLAIWLTFNVWAAAFLGLLFALTLNGPADWIRSKWSMPAWTATLLSILMVLTVVTGLGFLIGPPIVKQSGQLTKELPKAMEESLDWLEGRQWGRYITRHVELFAGGVAQPDESAGAMYDSGNAPGMGRETDTTPPRVAAQGVSPSGADREEGGSDGGAAGEENDTAQNEPSGDSGDGERDGGGSGDGESMVGPVLQALSKMLSVTASTTVLLLVSFVFTVYIAFDPKTYRRGVLWMLPAEHQEVAKVTMARLSVALRWWMVGRLASMVAVGSLTALGMWLIGMPAPLALGALAGLLSFVPNIGPIAGALPGLLIALPHGPWMFFSALGVYLAAQIVESNLISPLLDQATVATPPAVLIFAQVVMGTLTGVWGVLIASPLLVVVMVLTRQLYLREYMNKPIESLGNSDDEAADGEQ